MHDSAKGIYIIHNQETFHKKTIVYWNAKDWIKKQRDEAIRRANKRANDSQVGTLAVDASLGGVSSFLIEASLDQAYTIKTLSQKSHTSLNCSTGSGTMVDG